MSGQQLTLWDLDAVEAGEGEDTAAARPLLPHPLDELAEVLAYAVALDRVDELDLARPLTADAAYYLTGPLLLFPGWGETTPAWLQGVIPCARRAWVALGERGYATEEEALAYLYGASLSAPLTTDWARLYLWLGSRVIPRWGRMAGAEAFWTQVGADSPLRGEPTAYQMQELMHLRRTLWRRVVAHAKQGGVR